MTLEEAIKHCKEKAKELSDKAYQEWGVSMTEEEAYDCNECAKEHEQLSQWLEDYKRLLEGRTQSGWAFNRCLRCGAYHDGKYRNFCPNCGADMRGGAE